MNERIKELAEQAGMVKILEEHAHEYGNGMFENTPYPELEKFVELIVKECNQAVLEVPLYYKDYRSQIEEAVIRDCARAVLEKFGVEQ
jgi:hypothetical protein